MKGNHVKRTYRVIYKDRLIYEGQAEEMLEMFSNKFGVVFKGCISSKLQRLLSLVKGTDYQVLRRRNLYQLEYNSKIVEEGNNFMNVCYDSGYSYKWWQRRLNSEKPIHNMRMLVKDEWY